MSSQSVMASSLRQAARRVGIWSFINTLERIASFLLLILLAPLMLVTGLVIVALSGQSPLVAHLRIGQFGERVWTLKFRTMWAGRQGRFRWIEYIIDDSGPQYKNAGGPRFTIPVARVWRR